jgi:hypothetical protein
MTSISRVLGVVALAASPLVLRGQMAEPPATCMVAAPVDSVTATVYASAWTPDGINPLRREDAAAFVAAVGRGLRLPSPLSLTVIDGGRPRAAAVLTGAIILTMHGSHVSDVQINASSGSPEADSALAAAPLVAERAGSLPTLRDRDTIVVLGITTFDATARSERPAHGGDVVTVPIGTVRLPLWMVEQPAAVETWNALVKYPPPGPMSSDADGIHFPALLRDTVDFQFVVGPDGEIDQSTVLPRSARYGSTLASVERVLPYVRYLPARVGGCPVAQLVRQPFAFVDRDTTRVDKQRPVTIAVQSRSDTVTAMPAILTPAGNCWYVPAADTDVMRRLLPLPYDQWGNQSPQGAVRLAGHPEAPPGSARICRAHWRDGSQLPMPSGPGWSADGRATTRTIFHTMARFVVDSNGHVEHGSFHLLNSNIKGAEAEASRFYQSTRFEPATINGRPVEGFLVMVLNEVGIPDAAR